MALPRLLWLLADGLPHELLRAYVALRPRSALATWWRTGFACPLSPLAPNCQTPPSLFTLWSGLRPEQHGLLGYDLPTACRGGRPQQRDAFSHWPRRPALVWDLYARSQQRVRTCAVPFVQARRLGPALLSATEVFEPPRVPPAVLAPGQSLALAEGRRLSWRLEDTQGVLRLDGHLLWSVPITAGTGTGAAPDEATLALDLGAETHSALQVLRAQVDGQPQLVCLGQPGVRVRGSDAAARRTWGRQRAYSSGNPGKLYQQDLLGRRLGAGGEGQAERLLFRLMRALHSSFAADADWALAQDDADLVVAYYPVMDLIGHQVLRLALEAGQLAPHSLVGALLLDALDRFDAWVGALRERLPPDMQLLLNSDHGMSPIAWDLHPNSHFEQQAWLRRGADGGIDTEASVVFYHPADNGLLVFDGPGLAERGLAPAEVVASLNRALGRHGQPELRASRGPATALGPGWIADHYLHAPAGARLCAAPAPALVQASRKGGDHTTCNQDPWLRGVALWTGAPPRGHRGGEPLALHQLLPLVLAQHTVSAARPERLGTTP